jgi:dihydroneopterin aldolase
VVDATLLCDLRAAGRSDDLADTIDYAALYRCAEAFVFPGIVV